MKHIVYGWKGLLVGREFLFIEINLYDFSSMNTTHHLLLDETQKNVHMEAIYRYQTQLNYVDDGLFPLLSYQNILTEV